MKVTQRDIIGHTSFDIMVDGIKYIIHIINNHSNEYYARCIIEDTSTKARYFVHNKIELNSHVFTLSWTEKWDDLRGNYIASKDLTIYVDEIPEIDPRRIYHDLKLDNKDQNISLTIL